MSLDWMLYNSVVTLRGIIQKRVESALCIYTIYLYL